MAHWEHPHWHGYFPVITSYPSILGEMLSAGLNGVSMTWASGPSATELEVMVVDWLGKLEPRTRTILSELEYN